MKKILLLCIMAFVSVATWATEVTDVLTPSAMGLSNTVEICHFTGETGIEYNAYSSLQQGGSCFLINTNQSAICNTTTVGKVRKVTITGGNPCGGGNLGIYGQKDEPFEIELDGSNLTNVPSDDKLIGQIAYSAGTTKEIEIDGDYAYIYITPIANTAPPFVAEITITWEIASGISLSPANGRTIKSFNSITVAYDNGLVLGDVGEENIIVYDASGDVYATGVKGDYTTTQDADGTKNTSFTFNLSKAVDVEGEYTYIIPEGFFYFGLIDDYDSTNLSPKLSATVNVTGIPDTDVISLETVGYVTEWNIYSFTGDSGTEYKAHINGNFTLTVGQTGIWNTSSVGKVRKITITGPSEGNGGILCIYGQMDEPFDIEISEDNYIVNAPSDEYLIGEVSYSSRSTSEIEIDGDYAYIFLTQEESQTGYRRFTEITVTWDMGSDEFGTFECIVDPEDGEIVPELSQITFSNDEGIFFNEDFDSDDATVIVYDSEGEEVAYIDYLDVTEDANGLEIAQIVNLDEAVVEAGDYKVFVAAKLFYIIADGRKTYNNEITLSYTIEPEDVIQGLPDGYLVDPENKSYLESLSSFTLSLESGAALTQGSDFSIISVVDHWGVEVTTVTLDDSSESGKVICTLDEEISDEGAYFITFPKGALYDWSDDGGANPAFMLTYYVTGAPVEYSFDPEDGSTLSSLVEFIVACEDGIDCSYSYVGYITVYDENNNYITNDYGCETTYPEDDPWGDGLYCTITLNTEIVAEGTYAITIPEGYFIVGSSYDNSEEIVISYTIKEDAGTETGINGISINGENVEGIYAVGGQKLNTTVKGVNIVRTKDGDVKKIFVK